VEHTVSSAGRWTDEEHGVFVRALDAHGKDWHTIARLLPGRTPTQGAARSRPFPVIRALGYVPSHPPADPATPSLCLLQHAAVRTHAQKYIKRLEEKEGRTLDDTGRVVPLPPVCGEGNEGVNGVHERAPLCGAVQKSNNASTNLVGRDATGVSYR
jgi:hypothetical protein